MGVCCGGNDRYNPEKDSGDLIAINLSKISDPLEKFEKSFPFYRMHIMKFLEKVNSFGKDHLEL